MIKPTYFIYLHLRNDTGEVFYVGKGIAAEAQGHKMKTLYNWLSGHRSNPTSLEFA